MQHGGAKPLSDGSIEYEHQSLGRFESSFLDDLPYAVPSDNYSKMVQYNATILNRPSLEYNGNGVFTLAVTR
ncbi:MAG: hypothetical protein JJ975_16780, partial [Bacteroidia bacterium]|nr:hypothetical protein [Bacteroidia bacterium]